MSEAKKLANGIVTQLHAEDDNRPASSKFANFLDSYSTSTKPAIEPESQKILANYMSKNQDHERIAELANRPNPILEQLTGTGKFRGSDRASSGPSEALDSITGVPIRTAISEAQKGNFNAKALGKILQSIGSDPQKAPTGYDIASKATTNPYLGAGLATAVDLVQLPISAESTGVRGIVKDLAKPGTEVGLAEKIAAQFRGLEMPKGMTVGSTVPSRALAQGPILIKSGPAMSARAVSEAAKLAASKAQAAKSGIRIIGK